MPHTSRKKKAAPNKRKEVVDEEGWTRVTTTNSIRGLPQRQHVGDSDGSSQRSVEDSIEVPSRATEPRPMKPSKGTTMETMRAQYNKIEAKWLESDIYRMMKELLRGNVAQDSQVISNCVIFGSGSFCGDEIHWIDRHESAYYQIAAFKSMADTIGQIQGHKLPCYAQEPYYNDMDAAFLASLNITRVDHPKGFHLLNRNSVVYSPAAEPEVELQIMGYNPRVWLHRSLEHFPQPADPSEDCSQNNRAMIESFRHSHDFAQLPDLDVKNFPFHGSVLWWRQSLDADSSQT